MKADIVIRMSCAFQTPLACCLPTRDGKGTVPVQAEDCLEMAAEAARLRGWISYMDGNFSGAREAAHDALDGQPAPEGF